MNKSLSVFIISALMSLKAFAQAPFDSAKAQINKNPLEIEQVLVSHSKTSLKKAFITLHLKLADGHKAYESVFKIFSDSDSDLKISSAEVSPVEYVKDKFSQGKERLVLEGDGVMRFFISSKNTLNGRLPLKLTYQACSDDYCLLPKNIPFTVEFPEVTLKSNENELSQKSGGFDLKRFFANVDSQPMWMILILTYFFGLLTAFTPCVFPMIPITMGILGFSSTSSRFRGFLIGLFYALGLSVTYALVGVAAAMTGGFVGQALTNPYIVWSIFFFYVFMAFAMAGFFNIKAPSFIEQKFSKIENKGLTGAFLAGAVAGVIASPCVGPAVAAVLAYVAQTGKPSFGFVTLFTFGMGLGSLFIAIGAFYGEISSRLRPGKWMAYTKYLLSFLILIGALLFIEPHVRLLIDSDSKSQHANSELWSNYTTDAYEKALAEGKMLIIDFRADWCAACHELDEHSFSTEGFKTETQGMTLLKFDATKPSEKEQKELERFDVFGLPTVLFIDSTGKVRDDLTLTGFEEWPELQKRIEALKQNK